MTPAFAPGEPFPVPSKPTAVALGPVAAGDTWRFEAKGAWRDGFIACGPQGYRVFLFHALDIRPQMEDAAFFCLVGMLEGQPDSLFRIGRGTEHRFATAGTLVVFANDHPKMRWSNSGAVTLRAGPVSPMPPAEPVETLESRWQVFRRALDCTVGLPFVAAMVIGVAAVLAFLPQGRDLVRTVSEDAFGPSQVIFAVALLFMALQGWFWPRTIINFNYGSDRDRWKPRWFLTWAPRLVGLAPFPLVVLAAARNPAVNTAFVLATVVAAAVFFVFVLRRQDVWTRMARTRLAKSGKPPFRAGRLWVSAGLILAAITMIGFSADPVGPTRFIGAAAVVFLGIGLLIPPLVIAIQTGAPVRFPVLGTLVAAALLFGLWMDNHQVASRRAGSNGGPRRTPIVGTGL